MFTTQFVSNNSDISQLVLYRDHVLTHHRCWCLVGQWHLRGDDLVNMTTTSKYMNESKLTYCIQTKNATIPQMITPQSPHSVGTAWPL